MSTDPVEVSAGGLGPPPSIGRPGLALVWALLAAAGIGGLIWGSERLRLGRIGVEDAWLSPALAGPRLDRVPGGTPELYYHVRLSGVPAGSRLALECEWFDPSGVRVRHNRYETRLVDRDPWPTHCACPLRGAAPGHWRVSMSVAGRGLVETAFTVEGP